jgi:hypothetical protein
MKTNKVVKAEEWKKKLKKIWIWFDYLCIPQTSHYEDIVSSHDIDEEKKKCINDLKKAVASLPGYVELSDMMLILAPTCEHKNRKDPKTGEPYSTCLRSWRARGWCVAEMLCAFVARHQKDLLVVTSSEGTPFWGSPLDAVSIDLDRTNFTCCSLNHIMNGKPMSCDRHKVRRTLKSIVRSKIKTLRKNHLFFAARVCVYLESVWCGEEDLVRTKSLSMQDFSQSEGRSCDISTDLLTTLESTKEEEEEREWNGSNALCTLLEVLHFPENCSIDFIDEGGMTLIMWASLIQSYEALREIIQQMKREKRKLLLLGRTSYINKKLSDHGIEEIGIPGKTNALHLACRGTSGKNIVEYLVKNGANEKSVDANGWDGLMIAAVRNGVC